MSAFIINKRGPSKGARRLAKALKGRIYKKGDYIPPNSTVINWGDGQCSLKRTDHILNHPDAIQSMANKRDAFDAFSSAGVSIPRYAKSKGGVTWKGPTVVRHKLTGHSGEGIEIHEGQPSGLPDAPLYVEYIKKQDEYRIHVGKNGETYGIIAKQRKARDLSIPESEVNWRVRNHANGFVFVRQNINPPDCVLSAATAALSASGLDFGAVDVIYNTHERRAYVLEINTAPGLEGQTIEDYANFFRELDGRLK